MNADALLANYGITEFISNKRFTSVAPENIGNVFLIMFSGNIEIKHWVKWFKWTKCICIV